MANNQATTLAGAVVEMTSLDAVVMLERARNYLHGEPYRTVSTLYPDSSPHVRAHWSACGLLERKANQVCRGLKREWDKDARRREQEGRKRAEELRKALSVVADHLGVKATCE